MAKTRLYTQHDLAAAREFLDGLPSLKVDKFQRFGPEASVSEKLYAALHDEDFTLTDILHFLEKHGFSSTVDKLRTMRRVMFTLDIDQPESRDPSRCIDISRMRVHTWIKRKKITLDQVEVARQALAALPDLSQDRMSKGQFLSALADRFHTLSQEKGYSLLAIQEALRTIGVRTSPARIALLVTEYARRSKKREHSSKH